MTAPSAFSEKILACRRRLSVMAQAASAGQSQVSLSAAAAPAEIRRLGFLDSALSAALSDWSPEPCFAELFGSPSGTRLTVRRELEGEALADYMLLRDRLSLIPGESAGGVILRRINDITVNARRFGYVAFGTRRIQGVLRGELWRDEGARLSFAIMPIGAVEGTPAFQPVISHGSGSWKAPSADGALPGIRAFIDSAAELVAERIAASVEENPGNPPALG